MGKTADLTVVQKTTIDTLHKEGKTQKVIAKEAGCSQSSVSKHINREAKGRNRTLERIVKQNPFKNVGEIHKEWTAAGVSASRTTTHRRMQDMGLSCRIPCVKPLLNNRQGLKRLAWAKDKKDWTAAEWSKVMFSDESKLCRESSLQNWNGFTRPKDKTILSFSGSPTQWPWQGCCCNLPRESNAVRRSCVPPPPYRYSDIAPPPTTRLRSL